MDFLYFLNLYLWYGFGLPSYPLFSSYKIEDMGYVMLRNACNVMHFSPPHVHAHITSTPYSLHTLGQLFLQTSVSNKSSHTSCHQIFLIFCIKLAHYKRFKVTKPDFRKKNVLAQIWAQNWPKMRFLAHISRKNHQILLKTSEKVENIVWEAAIVKSNPKPHQLGPIFFNNYDHKD